MANVPLNLPAGVAKVFGCNITLKAKYAIAADNGATSDYYRLFTEWDWDGHVRPQLDMIRALVPTAAGTHAPCVRLIGDVVAVKGGAMTLAQYLACWSQLLDYCRSRGMLVEICGMAGTWWGHATLTSGAVVPIGDTSTPGTVCHTLNALLALGATSYADVAIGFDILNEPLTTSTAWGAFGATNAATVYNALTGGKGVLPIYYSDATTPITGFAAGVASAFAPYVAYCDLLAYHYYPTTEQTVANLDVIRATYPSKDIIFSEFGIPASATAAARKDRFTQAVGILAQAAYVKGAMAWSLLDYYDQAVNQYGLFDQLGAPKYEIIPWFVNQQVPAAGGTGTTVGQDSFAGTNGTGLPAHTPTRIADDAATTGAWAYGSVGTAGDQQLDGAGYLKATAGNLAKFTPAADPGAVDSDVTISMLYTSPLVNGHGFGVAFNVDAAENYYLARFRANSTTAGVWEIYRINQPGGAATAIGSAVAFTPANGATVVLRAGRRTATQGGIAVVTIFLSWRYAGGPETVAIAAVDAAPLALAAGLKAGLHTGAMPAGSSMRITDWQWLLPTIAAPTPAVDPTPYKALPLRWAPVADRLFKMYRLYKDGTVVYEGPLAQFVDTRVDPNLAHSYQVAVVDVTGFESAKSSALVNGGSNLAGGGGVRRAGFGGGF
jgi:hypothetical protein